MPIPQDAACNRSLAARCSDNDLWTLLAFHSVVASPVNDRRCLLDLQATDNGSRSSLSVVPAVNNHICSLKLYILIREGISLSMHVVIYRLILNSPCVIFKFLHCRCTSKCKLKNTPLVFPIVTKMSLCYLNEFLLTGIRP